MTIPFQADLEPKGDESLRDASASYVHALGRIKDTKLRHVLTDEIRYVGEFVNVINSLKVRGRLSD